MITLRLAACVGGITLVLATASPALAASPSPLAALDRQAAAGRLHAAVAASAPVGPAARTESFLAAAEPAPATPRTTGGLAPLSRQQRDRVDRILRGMSQEEKVGQVFTVAFAGQSATAPDATSAATNLAAFDEAAATGMIRRYHVGGVIYFGGNVRSPQQVAQLTRDVQIAARGSGAGVPLAVAIDQEGGNVTRLGAPASVSPGNAAIAATQDLSAAYEAERILAEEMRALGITWGLSPVVDVNSEPLNAADGVRSFGDDTSLVSSFSSVAVSGLHDGGVATSAKHFPGLGSTVSNSDFSVSYSPQTRKQFRRIDFPPFRAAIAAGTDSVMTAHLVAPNLVGSDTPTSLSRVVVKTFLRDELGFKGVVITDTLQAAALEAYTPEQRVVDAFLAGNDVLLMPVSLPGGIAALTQAVGDGTISQARLDRSVRRILMLKARSGMLDDPRSDSVAGIGLTVGTPDHLATMANIADDAVTLLAPQDATVPLTPQTGSVLVAGFGRTTVPTMAGILTTAGLTVDQLVVGTHPTEVAIAAAVAAAGQHVAVVLLTYNINNDPGQQALLQRMIATGVPVTVVMVGTPYDAAWASGAAAVVAAYSYQPPNLQAVGRALTGRPTVGALPVSIPTATDAAEVLYARGWGTSWAS